MESLSRTGHVGQPLCMCIGATTIGNPVHGREGHLCLLACKGGSVGLHLLDLPAVSESIDQHGIRGDCSDGQYIHLGKIEGAQQSGIAEDRFRGFGHVAKSHRGNPRGEAHSLRGNHLADSRSSWERACSSYHQDRFGPVALQKCGELSGNVNGAKTQDPAGKGAQLLRCGTDQLNQKSSSSEREVSRMVEQVCGRVQPGVPRRSALGSIRVGVWRWKAVS